MATVYVREQGAVVRRQGERIVVTKDGREIMDIPLIHLDQLALMGNVQLTTPAVALLVQNEVDVVFFSRYGKFRGRIVHTGSKFARLRHAQLRKMSDEQAALAIARAVVVGKLSNQRTILRRQVRDMPPSPHRSRVEQAMREIGELTLKAKAAPSLDVLRGWEGKAGACYFGALRVLLAEDWGFRGRAYYPPPDPINALLSFGYSLLLKDVLAAVQLVGLDPYLGFFHAIEYGRPSLALDMMEEFRPTIVDSLVLYLANNEILTKADFVWTREKKRPVRLSDKALELFIHRYEERINVRVFHPGVRQKTTYRRCFELQVRQLARVILGKKACYRPMTIK